MSTPDKPIKCMFTNNVLLSKRYARQGEWQSILRFRFGLELGCQFCADRNEERNEERQAFGP